MSLPLAGRADSTGRRNTCWFRRCREYAAEGLSGAQPAQRLTGSAVHLNRHELQMLGPVDAEVGALREVLAEQAVGVLIGAPLPGLGRIAEVDLETARQLDLGVVLQLHALVPGQRLPDHLGQPLDGCIDRLLDFEGTVAIG